MAARVLHVSDLHIGRREAPEPLLALHELAARLEPELLLATGDLSHRGRRAELGRAAELLESFDLPLLAVPGNHDIPYTVPARYTRTFAEWERAFGPRNPVHSSPTVFVAGLSSVDPWRHEDGELTDRQLAHAASALGEAQAGALRIVALHHHLAAPPWRSGKSPLPKRDHVLETLGAAGAELIVGGHVHQAGIAERREFEALEDGPRGSLVLATAPGLGRPRPNRRGEARGVNVYETDADSLTVRTFVWDGSNFAEVGRRSFPRSR
ncbi:MAG: metallophosphoesterase [Actinobacteria bacterium]|nr:metallophosphoesterase [Actinomycetota bacterium]